MINTLPRSGVCHSSYSDPHGWSLLHICNQLGEDCRTMLVRCMQDVTLRTFVLNYNIDMSVGADHD